MTDVADEVRATGLRATTARISIVTHLRASPGHHTAEAISAVTGLPRATTYSALADLAGTPLVDDIVTGGGATHYEAAQDEHVHFICRRCDAVQDVPDREGPTWHDVDLGGGVVESATVVLRGTCADCTAG